MRAILCSNWGGPESLRLVEVPPPVMQAGSLRVSVQAAGVNFADLLMIAGKYQENPPLPFIPGFEVSGIVIEAAPDAKDWQTGDRVMGMMTYGGYSAEAVVQAGQAFPVPPSMDFITAAGFPVAYGTAYGALAWRARLRPAEILLVFGAAGGLGLAAVAVGRALGAQVIAIAAGAERLAMAKIQGASHVIDYRTEDVACRVREVSQGRGANVVFDPVGGPAFDTGLGCIANEGRLIVTGFASGKVGQLSGGVALGKNIDLIGCYWGAYRSEPDRVAKAYGELSRWVETGRVRPLVATHFPLAEAGRALETLSSRRLAGKIVLTLDP